jgi:hypothetical protein
MATRFLFYKNHLFGCGEEKQTFMKPNLFYGIVEVAMFIGMIPSCEKERNEVVPPNQGAPPKKAALNYR